MSGEGPEIVVTGDVIRTVFEDHIVGHGVSTVMKGNKPTYIASVSGVVERIDKLITIKPLLRRYLPQVGDVVIGKVTNIAGTSWKLDINARQICTLSISSINLPGGHTRRAHHDHIDLSTIHKPDDIIAGEIQKTGSDGSAAMHTRSPRYGRRGFGLLVPVAAHLIVRQRQHFHVLKEINIELIIGSNGYIWIAPRQTDEEIEKKTKEIDHYASSPDKPHALPPYERYDQTQLSNDVLESMARLRCSILLLDMSMMKISLSSILYMYNESINQGIPVKDMVKNDIMHSLSQGYKNILASQQ